MSEQPVHVIANVVIEDAAKYHEYEKGFFPILTRHGGKVVALDENSVTFEGETPPEGRVVLLMFPGPKAATAWYEDPEYQALSEHRRVSTRLNFLTMVHSSKPGS